PRRIRLARALEGESCNPAEGGRRRAGELPADGSAGKLGGVDVDVVARGIGEDGGDERPGRVRTAARLAGRVRRGQRNEDRACRAPRSAVDVCRDGGSEVLRRELVADLSLSGPEANGRGSGADRIAGGSFPLARKGDLERAPACSR